MALEFNEQLSRLQKPDRAEMTDEEYAVFAKNVEVMEKNWGVHQQSFQGVALTPSSTSVFELQGLSFQ